MQTEQYLEQDAVDQILGAVDRIERKVDETNLANDKRFKSIETELAEHRGELKDHREQLAEHNMMLREQAQAITTVASAAARAVDHASLANQNASRSIDEATKIVESAIKIHSASISATVTTAVKQEVIPLMTQVEATKVEGQGRATAITELQTEVGAIKALVTSIAKTLGHPVLRWVILVCAAIGAVGGGFYAGYLAKQGTDAASETRPHAPARPLPPPLLTP